MKASPFESSYILKPLQGPTISFDTYSFLSIFADPNQLMNGAVANFVMNDKCAAGTGRFLEMMARTLGLSLEEMSTRGLKWKNNVVISSMCTVFAESEVVSLVAQNKDVADIIHGLNVSVASKVGALAARLGQNNLGEYMMTGGVARNLGVVRELEKKLGAPLFIAENPDLCGALGAALFALGEG